METLEARLRSALAAQDPVVEWNLHRLEDTLESPCDEGSRASPRGIPILQVEREFHEEEGLEAAATALLRSAADEEWSRPRGAGTSGHMYPTTVDDWAPPLFSPSSRRNEAKAAQSSLLDPTTEAPSAGPIPSWIYRGVGAVPLPPRPVSVAAGSTGSTGGARKPLEALDDQLQHLLLLQEQQLQRQMQLQEHQCRLQEMQLQQQEQQLEAQQRERERQERLDALREQQRQFEMQRKRRPPEAPSVSAQLPYSLQQQQQQQEMLNHILLLHQSSQLQQLRQVQTEQDRHLRELQQLQSPGAARAPPRREAPSRRQARTEWTESRQRAVTEQSGSQAIDAIPTSPSVEDRAPAVESWRRHEEQPPPEYEASSVAVSEAPESFASRVPSSRGSLRLQKDREVLQRRLSELEDS